MRRLPLVLALVAGCSSDAPAPSPTWVKANRIDVNTWGTRCGPITDELIKRPGAPGTWRRVWSNRDSPDSAPGIRSIICLLEYDNQSGRLYRLLVSVSCEAAMDRADAEQLIGTLILTYLPFEVQRVARAAVFDGPGRRRQRLGSFEIEGEWESRSGMDSIKLEVAHGSTPPYP